MLTKKKIAIAFLVAALTAGAGGAAYSLPAEEEHYWFYADETLSGPTVGKSIHSCTGRTYTTGTVTPYAVLAYTHPCYVFEDPPEYVVP